MTYHGFIVTYHSMNSDDPGSYVLHYVADPENPIVEYDDSY